MKFFGDATKWGTQFWPGSDPGMSPQTADMWPEVPAIVKNRSKNGQNLPNFLNIGESTVTGGCTCCLLFLGMKGTYIGFQSMVVSILDQVFKYRFVGLLSGTPENGLK